MTWDQVRELRDKYKWEIGSHTINHLDLTTLTATKLKQELLGAKNAFAAEKIDVKTFATPMGSYNNKVLTEIAKYYQSHRMAWGGINGWPDYFNDYEMVCLELKPTTTVAEAKSWIDEAISYNGWVVFLLHGVTAGEPGEYEYRFDDLEEILAYTKQKQIAVTTMSDGLKFSSKSNIVKNSSFTNLNSSGWANNWTRSGSQAVKIDTSSKGNVSGVKNSLHLIGGTNQNEAISTFLPISAGDNYLIRMYQNVQNLTSGGWAVYVEEYDANKNWVGGSWVGGNYANSIGMRYYDFAPTQSNAAYVKMHIYSEANSKFDAYIDAVEMRSVGSKK
jgi:hypothetical protein